MEGGGGSIENIDGNYCSPIHGMATGWICVSKLELLLKDSVLMLTLYVIRPNDKIYIVIKYEIINLL